ncbi:MAG: metal-sensing transcriptional repressor [Fimbriimonadaceae bacterium]|nr:metal-sensing transcriptional repressor [Fimbriimonadaceae bacterium]QYK58149.1 MAG: metal-sensing transcriptional repressor [Fimbriimonadaceae bacterium]
MNQEGRSKIDRRLARIEGQVRGLRKLVSENAYCCDILAQLSAASAALDQVAASVASNHIQHCIADQGGSHAHEATKRMSQEELFEELEDVLKRLVKT